jgi:OFA family oxalate/formate antiporter-like MFS transporter
LLVLSYGIVSGVGIGFAYVCPIAAGVKWFPDKRGLITGLAVAGFGAGGLVFTPVAKTLIASSGIMATFLYLGLIFFVAVVLGAQLMINPPAGYKPAGWNPPAPAAGGAAPAKADYTFGEMLKTVQFWLLWLTYFAGCTAGLMVIMNVTNVWQSFSLIGKAGTTIPNDVFQAVISQGATAVIVVAIFHSLGRIVWGKVSDSIGRKPTLLVMFLVSGAAMLVLNWLTGYALYLTGAAVVGFCFGGFLALFPAVTADYFGTKNIGVNYGFMFLAYGAGGLFGPWLAPKLMKVVQTIPYLNAKGVVEAKPFEAGNYMTAFLISGAMCLVSALIILVVKPPAPKAQA